MDDLVKQSSMIKAGALKLGFNGCGISQATHLPDDEKRLGEWLGAHYHGDMAYMENNFDKRVDPTKLVEDSKSVISVILNYYPSEIREDAGAPVVSKYAYGEDYHGIIKKKLKLLLQFINELVTPVNGRAFVDSAPVLDRAWASRSGLGWIGKNTMLISPEIGSFIFIGTLIVDIPLHYDRPIHDFCGDCNRCIRACPTGALVKPRVLDSRKCISFLTIENKGDISPDFRNSFENRVFGCDICQDVCPWNRKAKPHTVEEFKPVPNLLEMTKQQWYELDETQYNELFASSAVKRAKYAGLRRNLDYIK